MPNWCNRCGALLPESIETCPRCGKKIGSTPADDADLTNKEIMSLSLYVLRFLLIPLMVVFLIGAVCYLVFFR